MLLRFRTFPPDIPPDNSQENSPHRRTFPRARQNRQNLNYRGPSESCCDYSTTGTNVIRITQYHQSISQFLMLT